MIRKATVCILLTLVAAGLHAADNKLTVVKAGPVGEIFRKSSEI